ncbi:WxL domain-containing protein [Leuconostoc sp. C2]|uniref:WxL domain-containing protein n=1 Tax=Leuconostoc sp. (strain C2) TaxID=979982 RepID=UPI0002175870|nr:WxL domain-containing protein [Leuconostoc sp. C2]AEJ30746.1 cell surface protein [Leuconostoc sp. C2]
MINYKLTALLLGTAATTALVSVNQASADSVSNGTVTFEQSTDGIQVLDPNDNSKTFTPGSTDGTTNLTDNIDNGLYLAYVPNFNFNTHRVNQIRDKVFFANIQAEGRPNFVQVSDLRQKNSNNWKLDVSVGAFTNKNDSTGKDTLDGAALIFRNVKDQNVTANTTSILTGTTTLGDNFSSLMNGQNAAANATTGETAFVMQADGKSNSLVDGANGTHLLTAGDQSTAAVSVGLYVPRNTQSAAKYDSDITWKLALDPTSGN